MTEVKKQQRVVEIELMKAIAIIGMVFVHVLEGSLPVFEDAWELPGSIPYTLIEFIGGIPAAGAFTFAMGWGAAYSDKATPASYRKRALKLFILMFYVNFVYAIFPSILDPANFGALSEHPYAIIGFNIYSFATICMLFFALMKELKDAPVIRGIICTTVIVLVFIISVLTRPESYTTGNPWADTLIGIFVRQNHYSWFPLVPWITFPIMGYGAGNLYRRWQNKKQFALCSLGIGVVLVVISQIVIQTKDLPNAAMNPGWVTEIDYYSLIPANIVCGCGILCIELALAFGIMALFKGALHPVLAEMSKNVMEMFVGHWIFISPLFPLLRRVTSVWVNVIIGFVVLIATFWLVRWWKTVRKK